jgi:hypothetical protein
MKKLTIIILFSLLLGACDESSCPCKIYMIKEYSTGTYKVYYRSNSGFEGSFITRTFYQIGDTIQ